MNNTLAKIEALEKSLSRAVAGRATSLEAIAKLQAHAESVIESFANDPAPEKVDKVYQAHAALAVGRELLEPFSNLTAWKAELEST